MSSNIRIVAELDDRLTKDLRALSQKTSKDLGEVSEKLRNAQADLKKIGNTKITNPEQRAEILKTIDALQRQKKVIEQNEKAESQRITKSANAERQRRIEIDKTTLATEKAAAREVNAHESRIAIIKKLGALTVGVIGIDTAKGMMDIAGQFEQYKTSLKVLMGSSEQAQKSFDWIKDFTRQTPYEVDQVMESFIRLKSYGIDGTDGSLRVLGDTASALGKPLMSAVEAMADAMTGENERLKEFGIRAKKMGDEVKYSWIDSHGKAKETIIQNNSEIIKSTLEAIFNEKYKGLMEEQSKTWVGAVSNLDDAWKNLKDTIARESGMFDMAKSSVETLNGVLSNQNGELDAFLRYGKEAVAVGATFYGVTLGASAVSALKTLILYEEGALTRAIALEAAFMRLKKFLVANTLTLTVAAVLTGSEYVKDLIEGDKVNPNGSKALQNAIAKRKEAESLEAQARAIGENYNRLAEQLKRQEESRNKLLASGISTTRVDEAIKATKIALKDSQSVAEQFYTISGGGDDFKALEMKSSIKKLSAGTVKAPQKKGASVTASKNVFDLESAMNDARIAAEKAFADQDDKDTQHKLANIDKERSALLSYYEIVGNKQDAFYMNLGDELAKLADSGALTEKELQNVFNVRTDAFKKSIEDVKPELDKIRDDTIKLSTVFDDAFKSMEDSIVNTFMTGKFSAQDFFNTVVEGIIRMQIRNSITEPLTKAIGGINFGSMFSGMFGGSGVSGVGSEFGIVDGVSYGANANGNAFIGGQPISVHAFANGGAFTNAIVSKPTLAPMALFGEAGAEAIMPLSRDGSGRLGVSAHGSSGAQNVNVHIYNESGQQVEATKTDVRFDACEMVISVWLDALARNKGGVRDAVRSIR